MMKFGRKKEENKNDISLNSNSNNQEIALKEIKQP